MLHLFDEEKSGVKVLSWIIGSAVVSIVVEEVDGYLLLRKKHEELCVEVKLSEGIEAVDIVDGYCLLPLLCLKVKGVFLSFQSTAL